MNVDQVMTALAAGLVGFGVAAGLTRLRLNHPPSALMRANIVGDRVPAVLGGPLSVGGLVALVAVAMAGALGWEEGRVGRVGTATALVIAVMWFAGSWDDRKGDERPRGFQGHLNAARRGAVTGGIVKLAAGIAAGAAAGGLVAHGRVAIEVALLVALASNLLNLLDRAPGRAAKVGLLTLVPVAVWAPAVWIVAAAGIVGALLAVLPSDLAGRAMLGDAGANPLGAVLGLGAATAYTEPVRLTLIGIMLALTLLSERWSFSAAIDRNRVLRSLDRLGRADTRGH